jgi:SAM-dependent methyltransferase
VATNTYIGSELELFSKADNWKAYYAKFLRRHLVGDVLEVGAGIGATTKALCDGSQKRWVCLEPDPAMSATLLTKLSGRELPACCEAVTGAITDLALEELFDAIVYIDVLEHIEADGDELMKAAGHLRPGGRLVILAPAHRWLYTAFDKAIGHFRRYNKESLSKAIPAAFEPVEFRYLDSAGLMASLGNRLLLKSDMPTSRQIALWDKAMVPLSRLVDPLVRYRLGKSLLGVWRKKL